MLTRCAGGARGGGVVGDVSVEMCCGVLAGSKSGFGDLERVPKRLKSCTNRWCTINVSTVPRNLLKMYFYI